MLTLLTIEAFIGLFICIVLIYKKIPMWDFLFLFLAFIVYYLSNPSDIEFIKMWGRPLGIILFNVINFRLLKLIRGKRGSIL